MPKDIDIYSHSIVRVPCLHCSHLCSSQARNCPKCREPIKPLYDPSEIEKILQESNITSIQYYHIRQLEYEIKKKIPLVQELSASKIGFAEENGDITGLSLYNCGLENLPRQVLQISTLKILLLRRNEIKTIPLNLGFLTFLETLDLRINKIRYLPDSIGLLSNLKRLNLSSNDLFVIPNSIGDLSSLEILNLSNNKLRSIPDSLGSLLKLRELNIKANFWINLPKSVKLLKKSGLTIIS